MHCIGWVECGKKTLKLGNEVPSIFSFKIPQDKLPRKPPCKKSKYPEFTTNTDTETHTIIDSTKNVDCENGKPLLSEKTMIEKKNRSISMKVTEACLKNTKL